MSWPRQVSESWRLPAFVRLLMQGLKVDIADPGQRADAEAILLKALAERDARTASN